mmetsp:Transcript_5520/g.13533  ORF Transcript_5520/g.13533 Transcript_5520/m.13533 type:complete len:111 (+) Transcript_5520:836-1168(+)
MGDAGVMLVVAGATEPRADGEGAAVAAVLAIIELPFALAGALFARLAALGGRTSESWREAGASSPAANDCGVTKPDIEARLGGCEGPLAVDETAGEWRGDAAGGGSGCLR